MKKSATIFFLFISLSFCSRAQDMGFHTTDIGGEFQKFTHSSIYNLHIAFNAKLNHSVQLRAGYNQVPVYRTGDHTEVGKGWGGGLGYRYYFKPFPYKFFVGVRTDFWAMKIEVDYSPAAGPYIYPKSRLIIHPALEAGYTFIINDIVYFTPYITAGFQTSLSQSTTYHYGKGFVPAAGISAGFRL